MPDISFTFDIDDAIQLKNATSVKGTIIGLGKGKSGSEDYVINWTSAGANDAYPSIIDVSLIESDSA